MSKLIPFFVTIVSGLSIVLYLNYFVFNETNCLECIFQVFLGLIICFATLGIVRKLALVSQSKEKAL